MPDGFPVVREAFARTVRLVATARLRAAVLKPLLEDGDAGDDGDDLAALAELEGATSARLIGESRGIGDIPANEFVHGVPHAAFINASFAYAKPRQPGRFNGPERGAWYAALEVETCLREVAFHMADFLGKAGDYHATADYAGLHASLAGEFVDLRGIAPTPPCLDADTAVGYPAGNALAAKARADGLNGIIYPSVRHETGTCVVALRPHAVQSVVQGDVWRLVWNGGPDPVIERISGD